VIVRPGPLDGMLRPGGSPAPEVAAAFRREIGPAAAWPLPGSGRTADRFAELASVAARDLSVARLIEAHADALAILAEAGRGDLADGSAYGVWASDGTHGRLVASPVAGGWRLAGIKQFASGTTIVDRALVTAHAPDGLRLFVLALDQKGVEPETAGWATAAFASTATGMVRIATLIPETQAVGAPGFYLARPGFWHGAVGVAACWAGGARGLSHRYVREHSRDDPHALAHRGAVAAACWGMTAALATAGAEIDADPLDLGGTAMARALTVRHLVERDAQEILLRLGRAAGPRAAAFDAWFAQQSADLALYLRQCHAERDLEALGRALVGDAKRPERAGATSARRRSS
jgi:hypothetical protein